MKVINPKATKTVEVEESSFTVGIVPYGKRVELESMAYVNKDKEVKTKEDVQALLEQNFEFVRWGIKGHSNVAFSDGSPVAFKSSKEKLGEIEYDVVADEVMQIYAATPGLLAKLVTVVGEFNYIKGDVAKN